MKKIIGIIIMISLLSSCTIDIVKTQTSNDASSASTGNNVLKLSGSADYMPVADVNELLSKNENAFIGRIKSVSFSVMDKDFNTVESVAAPEDLLDLFYTVYEIEIISVLKGNLSSNSVKLISRGGVKDYKVEEQTRLINSIAGTEFEEIQISISDGIPDLSEGKTYLILSNTCGNYECLDAQGVYDEAGELINYGYGITYSKLMSVLKK